MKREEKLHPRTPDEIPAQSDRLAEGFASSAIVRALRDLGRVDSAGAGSSKTSHAQGRTPKVTPEEWATHAKPTLSDGQQAQHLTRALGRNVTRHNARRARLRAELAALRRRV